jgi:hypothetical protein
MLRAPRARQLSPAQPPGGASHAACAEPARGRPGEPLGEVAQGRQLLPGTRQHFAVVLAKPLGPVGAVAEAREGVAVEVEAACAEDQHASGALGPGSLVRQSG